MEGKTCSGTCLKLLTGMMAFLFDHFITYDMTSAAPIDLSSREKVRENNTGGSHSAEVLWVFTATWCWAQEMASLRHRRAAIPTPWAASVAWKQMSRALGWGLDEPPALTMLHVSSCTPRPSLGTSGHAGHGASLQVSWSISHQICYRRWTILSCSREPVASAGGRRRRWPRGRPSFRAFMSRPSAAIPKFVDH